LDETALQQTGEQDAPRAADELQNALTEQPKAEPEAEPEAELKEETND
jgi:hypothetical protein